MNKKKIKKMMLEKRLSLGMDEIRLASDRIADKIKKMDSFIKAETVLFYYPFRNEADMLPLMREIFASKTVGLPRIEEGESVMTARKITGIDELEPGAHGILSPSESAEIIMPEDIDFIVVPLVAYDSRLHRIGYGGGYYDRFLPKCVNAVKCGAAYSFQNAGDVFPEDHDVRLDEVVTEI